jgi:hypothetical protein
MRINQSQLDHAMSELGFTRELSASLKYDVVDRESMISEV